LRAPVDEVLVLLLGLARVLTLGPQPLRVPFRVGQALHAGLARPDATRVETHHVEPLADRVVRLHVRDVRHARTTRTAGVHHQGTDPPLLFGGGSA
jgi:hypothetical protein